MKEMYKKWLSIFSVVLLVSSFIVSSVSPFVSATSGFDQTYKSIDSLTFENASTCSDYKFWDYSANWSSELMSPAHFRHYDSEYFDSVQDEIDSFHSALDHGDWGVSSVDTGSNGTYIVVYWSQSGMIANFYPKSGDLSHTWMSPTPKGDDRVYALGFVASDNSIGGSCNNPMTDGGFSGTLMISGSDSAAYFYYNYLFTGDVNYPEGYAGEQVREGVQEQINPDFTVDYSDKSVTMKHKKTFDKLPTVDSDYMVEYSIMACSSVDNNTCALDESKGNKGLIDYKLSKPGQSLSVDVPSYGYYQIQAEYLQTGGDCHSLEYNPDSGGFHTTDPDDYCYFQKPEDKNGYTYTSTTVNLKVDGSTGMFDTADLECDLSGTCEIPSKYEDCSVYAPTGVFDWGAFLPWFSCIGRNIAVWVGDFVNSIFRVLFVPDSRFLTDSFTNLKSNLDSHLGVLTYPFAFIGGIVDSMQTPKTCSNTNPNSTKSSLSLGGGFFGKQFNMNMCDVPNNFPSMWNIMVIIINVVTYFGLIAAYYAVFVRVFGGGRDGYMSDARREIDW